METNDALMEKIRRGNQQEAAKAVNQLVEGDPDKAVQKLVSVLGEISSKYEKRFIVYTIIEALGKIGSPEAEKVLLEAVDNPFYYIKKAALESLTEVDGDEQAVEKINRVLNGDLPEEVKKPAIKAMGTASTEKAVDKLKTTIKETADPELKKEAIKSLARTGQEESLPSLMNYYYIEANDMMKHEIIKSLARIATTGSIEFLINALQDKQPDIRACAAAAVGETRNKLGEQPLKNLLTDPDGRVRKEAAKALGLIKYLPK